MVKLAVAFVHGIEIEDPAYAASAIKLLERHFARHAAALGHPNPNEGLVIRAVNWSPVMQRPERDFLYRLFGANGDGLFSRLRWLVTRMHAGWQAAVVPFALAGSARRVPGLDGLSYPALRWLITEFVGDAIGYQTTPGERRTYDAIHGEIARELSALAVEAGDTAPLCVIAHSLGTVITSNYFYDLHVEQTEGRVVVPPSVELERRPTPLELGETLAHFYTLGSPIALWALRYPGFGVPITVPALRLREHHPDVSGEWVNFYDKDDLVAFPLKCLSDRYAAAVTEDREVSLRGILVGWNPLVHPWYWNDARVIDPIAAALARTWQQASRCSANVAAQPPDARSASRA